MKNLKELKYLEINSFFKYKGKVYEVTSDSAKGVERRVYNHTNFRSELLPVYLKVWVNPFDRKN